MKPWNFAAGHAATRSPSSCTAGRSRVSPTPGVIAGTRRSSRARGYGVVFIDFHGSTGYGQAFTDSISGDWGGKPLEDLQKGLAAAAEKFPWLDGDRACALGALLRRVHDELDRGQLAGRLPLPRQSRRLFDNRSMYYSTEELWFPEWDHGGPYYENPEAPREIQSRRTS